MSSPIETTELAQQTAEAVEATGGLGMLGINLKIFIAQLVNFVLVLLVLWKWVYQPLVKLLDERSKRIEQSMKHAEEIEEKMKSVEEEQGRLLSEAKASAAAVMEQAREDAERRKSEMLHLAKEEVQRVVVQGKEQLRSEKQQMIREAKVEMAEIAVEAAKRVLQESIDEKRSQTIAEQAISKLVT